MAGTSRQPLTMIPRATTPSARGVARTAERRTEGPANARRRSPGGSRRGGAGEVARRKAAAAGGHYYGRRSSPSPVVVSAAWFFLLLNLKDESWTAKVPCCRFSLPLRFWRRNLASGSAAVSVFSRHVPDPSVIVALEGTGRGGCCSREPRRPPGGGLGTAKCVGSRARRHRRSRRCAGRRVGGHGPDCGGQSVSPPPAGDVLGEKGQETSGEGAPASGSGGFWN